MALHGQREINKDKYQENCSSSKRVINFLGNSFQRLLVPRYVSKSDRQGKLDPASEEDQPR